METGSVLAQRGGALGLVCMQGQWCISVCCVCVCVFSLYVQSMKGSVCVVSGYVAVSMRISLCRWSVDVCRVGERVSVCIGVTV